MRIKKISRLSSLILLLVMVQTVIGMPIKVQSEWDYSMRTYFPRDFDLFEDFNASDDFKQRKSLFLNCSRFGNGLSAQASRIYVGDSINEGTIESAANKLFEEDGEGFPDFTWVSLVRVLYLDINKSLIPSDLKERVCEGFGQSVFWYTQANINDDIVFTENHQMLCHTTEYLIGQLFPNDTFVRTGLTGEQHAERAKELVEKWIDRRARLGFSEWNSNSYLNPDIASLLNIVDFASDEAIVKKAAMLLDIIAFGFANHYFKNRFATTMGRCYDSSRIPSSSDGISEVAWLMVGLSTHNPCDNNDRASCALATSDHYAPPPIIEDIAKNASKYFEHKERQGIYLDEGKKYGIEYNEEDLMYWWGMSAPVAPEIIGLSFDLLEDYNIDPNTILGPQVMVDLIKITSFLRGLSLGEYSQTFDIITRGVSLETANNYVYRTPYYQLAGCQDHMKGMNSFQEHIWQASLSDNAYVFTNNPTGITKNFEQLYMGGWKPRGTFYKNMGIIQYDRESMALEAEFLMTVMTALTGFHFYQHAYFPRSNFDEVYQKDGWTFGKEGDSYVALYSSEPTYWVSDYELRVIGDKNVWIVELGSIEDYNSFEDFQDQVLDAELKIIPESIGYDIEYDSPLRGEATVSWEDPFYVDGEQIDLGDYPRFDNEYCYQEFGSEKTVIEFENQRLELNFNNASRIYDN